jgi:hypothetical protein
VNDFVELPVFSAAKRCGLQHAPWMGDWFTSWSPRNDNNNAEGSWHHWANLAAYILSHPATQIVAPELYRADLKPDETMYSGGNQLTDEQITSLFRGAQPGGGEHG